MPVLPVLVVSYSALPLAPPDMPLPVEGTVRRLAAVTAAVVLHFGHRRRDVGEMLLGVLGFPVAGFEDSVLRRLALGSAHLFILAPDPTSGHWRDWCAGGAEERFSLKG
jgi:hypothetical protein